jgi:predicted nucleic acid-binding protein
MNDRAFIDTNIFIYLYSTTDNQKKQKAISVLNDYDCLISTQVLNEFCNVARKKLNLSFEAIQESLNEILAACRLSLVNLTTIKQSLALQSRYGFSYYDSLILASALDNVCQYLLSEDLTNNQTIENLTIINPFIR